jgi:hypothetical protein
MKKMQTVFIRNTSDGRKVEVIGTYVCIDGKPVADGLVEVETHPNRKAILSTLPNATHMAGPLAFTTEEASTVRGALAAAVPAVTDPAQISKRFRNALNIRDRNAGIE